MKVFLDTNIILDLFRLSGPDLEEVRKLTRLVQANKLELLLTQQVLDEFRRNREKVISEALAAFGKTKAEAQIPNLIRVYPKAEELNQTIRTAKQLVKDLQSQVKKDIENNALKADEVILELFGVATILPLPKAALGKAQLRMNLGNPPGKRDSLGDALIWETLLDTNSFLDEEKFVFLSGDGDFRSELTENKLKEFLQLEWDSAQPKCSFHFEKSLVVFLGDEFPEIDLAGEVDKMVAIEQLANADSFARVHAAIAHLNLFEDLLPREIQQIANIVSSNNQIYRILSDEDVLSYMKKINTLLVEEGNEEVKETLEFLLSLEPS